MTQHSIAQTLLELRSMVHAATEYNQVQTDWFPANRVKLLLDEDPALIWLEHFGHLSSFVGYKSEYRLSDSVSSKNREFEKTWCKHHCLSVVRVCSEADEVRSAKKVRETFALMIRCVPAIGQAALWWAPEQIYGTADLLVHSVWLNESFSGLMTPAEAAKPALHLGDAGTTGHYVVVEFKTEQEERKNGKDQQVYAARVRLYSYMLGQLQGVMPAAAYVITRDKVSLPFEVPITSKVAEPLDGDLASLRDQFANKAQRAKRFALAS